MKIVNIKIWKQNLKLTKPYSIANHYFDSAENIFIKIILENGVVGIGAGCPSVLVCNEPINQSLALLQEKIPSLLINKNINHFIGHLDALRTDFLQNPAALACVDIALHDAFCKLHGIAIVDFYGRCHEKLPTSITLGIMSLEESEQEIKTFTSQGFKVVKVKIGEAVDKDIQLCKSIDNWSNSSLKIRVDGNQGYTPSELIHFEKATKVLEIEFVEQPLPRNKVVEMQKLPHEISMHSMADENLHGPEDAIDLISPSSIPFGLFNIKLMKCGGIFRGNQIARLAATKNINLMWGCMDESRVSIAAALHIAYACPNTRYLDLDGHLDLAEDIAMSGFEIDDGYMLLKKGLGLGVDLIEQVT